MEQVITVRKANRNDYYPVTALLQENELPTEDIQRELLHFMVAEADDVLAGSAGLECFDEYALLRSVVIGKSYRNLGLATQLVNSLFEHAKQQGVKKIFLITNTAETYFERKGFTKTSREEVPAAVLQSREFNGLCPSSATIMVRSL